MIYPKPIPRIRSVKTETHFMSLMAKGEITAREVWQELERLREYEWKYKDLSK